MPVHDGNRNSGFWNASLMLCQLSYVIRLIGVGDLSKQSCFFDINIIFNVTTITIFKFTHCLFTKSLTLGQPYDCTSNNNVKEAPPQLF